MAPVAEMRGFGWVLRMHHLPSTFSLIFSRMYDNSSLQFVAFLNLENEISSPISVLDPKNGDFHKMQLKASAPLPASAMEKATKWDPDSLTVKPLDNAYQLACKLNLLEDHESKSFISTLQLELQQARARVNGLELERQSAKKKLDQFLKKLSEEKAAWRSREHEKVRAIIDGMKGDLSRERKNRHRLEIINSKLINELSEAKLSAKRLLQDYDKERKARELIEEVCDELAKEIEEDKVEVEILKRETAKIREEVDEERRMLQMAEVWREERVQMKLIDAKLTLECKYSQLIKLQQEIEAFLREYGWKDKKDAVVKKADHLKDAIDSVKVEEIEEFTYEPPPESEDILSVFEELHPREEEEQEEYEKEIEPCYGSSSALRESEIHEVASPETDLFLENSGKLFGSKLVHNKSEIDDGSSWETISHEEEQGSSTSPGGSEPSVNKFCEESNASLSVDDWEENQKDSKLNTEIGENCCTNMKKSRKKDISISRLWRSSYSNNGDHCKRNSVEITNGRPSNGGISNGICSPEGGIDEVGRSPRSIGHWNPPDSVSQHFSRGIKGCIEWPRGAQKHSLKAKLLEARMESQKIQLRHVLKQKI
uniref:Uncharacterized protein n=1 Tax=Ananas comosus var. bracteatus TaxID=296719 RepID=A0A6V7QV32_ANACO